jgi:hypothetical protein
VRAWLWEHAADKPRRPPGGLEETDVAWVVKTPQLELSIAKADLSMVVTAAPPPWRFLPCDDQDVEGIPGHFGLQSAKSRTVAPFNTGYSVGLTMTLSDFPDAPGLELYLDDQPRIPQRPTQAAHDLQRWDHRHGGLRREDPRDCPGPTAVTTGCSVCCRFRHARRDRKAMPRPRSEVARWPWP